MKTRDFTTTISLDETPEAAFAAINDVRAWWTGAIEGRTDKVGEEFTYRYKDLHYSKQRITELVPGRKVVWLVVDSALTFIEDKAEWNGTEIRFEIARKGPTTEVVFTHVGLVPDVECYGACSSGWGSLITRSLRSLIATGKATPFQPESPI